MYFKISVKINGRTLCFNYLNDDIFSEVHSDISCEFKASGNIYPFGYRTHAHSLSK